MSRLLQRLSEIAADDEAPWVKIGDVCVRASRILGKSSAVVVEAEIPDAAIVHALEQLRSDKFHQGHAV